MIIMALDHVRDYFHADAFFYDPTNLSQTTPSVFFTRWITHFCAPVFVFLAGTSAFLSSQRKSKKELAYFLLTRGLWLIFLEITVVNFAWMFDISFSNLDLAVIWALGGSMIALAALIFLPVPIILTIGALIIFGHNLLDDISVRGNDEAAFGWGLLHQSGMYEVFERSIFVTYPILPWIGVMALGYGLGSLYTNNVSASTRKRFLLSAGLISILFFILLRFINVYGEPMQWSVQNTSVLTILSFLNVTKYPPSLLFVLMTLGPALIFLAVSEKSTKRFTNIISTYGRVPMFYYLLHLYLIHLLAMFAAELTTHDWRDMVLDVWVTENPGLDGYGFSLALVYLIWLGIIITLYPLCRWYDRYKTANKQKWWLSYL
jgi:uncharacterized membrane protein